MGGVGQLFRGRQLLVKLLVGNIEVGAVALSPKVHGDGQHLHAQLGAALGADVAGAVGDNLYHVCIHSFSDAIFQAAPGAPAAYFCLL